MSDGASIFSMVSGIGDGFSKAYAGARKQAQEDEAPGLIEAYLRAGQAGSPGALPSIAPVAGGGAVAGGTSGTPVFAANSGAIGDYLAQTRARESGGNDLAQNPNSTAKGRFQFTDGTWAGVAKRHPDLGLTPGGWSDPDQQERAMQAFTADNAKALTAAGLPINPGTLYASHFLGEAGGPKFVGGAMSNPDQPAIALATPGAVRANRTVFFEKDGRPKTAGQVFSWMGGSMPSQAAPTAPAAAPVAVASNEAETQALEQRMGMVPPAATAVASADPDAANKPAPGAVPTAGFLIPGQADSASVVPTAPQAFPGFGTRSDRTSPEQMAALNALWKNPVTRPIATQALASVLKGQDVSWSMVDLGHGRKALFDAKSARMLPLPGTGDQFVDATDGDGNQFKINSATGERSLVVAAKKPEKDDGEKITAQVKAREQAAPGIGLIEGTPAWQSFVGTGKIGRDQDLSATDKKAILEADEKVLGIQGTLTALGRAKELSKDAYSGPGASTRGYLGSMVGLERAEKTQELDNTITAQALDSLKATFGAAPTEGERKILLDIQGSSSQSPAVRAAIYARAEQALQKRLAFEQARADDLRGGTFYKKGPAAGAPASTARTAPSLPVRVTPSMKPEDIQKRFPSGTRLILPDGSEGVVP